MAAPLTKRFRTLVADYAAAAQGACATALDFTDGSVFLALGEATAGLGTWLQKLYLFALSVTRLASSFGIWVDTFVAPFGMTRLGSVAATGPVTFSRFVATSQLVIPIGAQVGSQDGTQVFQVYADPTNGAYSATAATDPASGLPIAGYLMLAGANTVSVPVQALTRGTAGNVAANTIVLLRTSILGVDAVTNPTAFTNGLPAETDGAVKARFPLVIASLAKGTTLAIEGAVAGLAINLSCQIVDVPGLVTVYVDDGSGSPPPATVSQAAAAVNAVRAAGVQTVVLSATPLGATIQMNIRVAPGYVAQNVLAAVTAALTVYVNGLGFGTTLGYLPLAAIAQGVPGVVEAIAGTYTINGGTTDLVPAVGQTIKVASLVVNQAV